MRIGILGTSDIAFRRFLPALQKCTEFTYAGVASRTPQKAVPFQEAFGGTIYETYDALIEDETIDAVYVPLPPALHYAWGRKVLEHGKHLFMEKPFAATEQETRELLELAEERHLIVHENYMFLWHAQMDFIRDQLRNGTVGDIRVLRMSFGFPRRSANDFRYDRSLGGGAILDCGGYPIRLALELLGNDAQMTQACVCGLDGFEVEMYGNAVMTNAKGQTAQIAFGMDNAYRCELEIWGSNATLRADRIFTAGADYQPVLTIQTSRDVRTETLEADDQFLNSIRHFAGMINKGTSTEAAAILRQAQLVDQLREGIRHDSI